MRTYKLLIPLSAFVASFLTPMTSYACEIGVRDMNHIPHTITPSKGEWLLIQAWTLDCAVCERQKPELSALNETYDKLKIVNLSLDGNDNIAAIRERVSEKQHSMKNYIMEPEKFQATMNKCFGKDYVGTPTYILYSPEAEVVVVRTGPFDLGTLPKQLDL